MENETVSKPEAHQAGMKAEKQKQMKKHLAQQMRNKCHKRKKITTSGKKLPQAAKITTSGNWN